MLRFITLTIVLYASSLEAVSAQNCLPKPSAVAWFEDFTPQSQSCSRVDYLFYPQHEAWYCGGSYVMDFPNPPINPMASAITAHVWYFEWRGFFDYTLWPTVTLFCRCSVESCQVRGWQ